MLGNSVIKEWEYKIAEHCKQDYCIATCNASQGIFGAFMALGLSGKEIITTPMTWSGALSGLLMLGCDIKFCDVEANYLSMDPEKLQNAITPETRAVFTADFLGYPCRLDDIKKICQENNIYLIHDAATSYGSYYKGHQSGYFADVSIYSFGTKKLFSIGEGGAIVTKDGSIYKKLIETIGHPERQQIEFGEVLNPFSINMSMNVLGAEFGLKNFDKEIKKIKNRAKSINKKLNLLGVNQTSIDFMPNFYKILIDLNCIGQIEKVYENYLRDLPFKPIYKQAGFENHNFPILENTQKYLEYRILEDRYCYL